MAVVLKKSTNHPKWNHDWFCFHPPTRPPPSLSNHLLDLNPLRRVLREPGVKQSVTVKNTGEIPDKTSKTRPRTRLWIWHEMDFTRGWQFFFYLKKDCFRCEEMMRGVTEAPGNWWGYSGKIWSSWPGARNRLAGVPKLVRLLIGYNKYFLWRKANFFTNFQ